MNRIIHRFCLRLASTAGMGSASRRHAPSLGFEANRLQLLVPVFFYAISAFATVRPMTACFAASAPAVNSPLLLDSGDSDGYQGFSVDISGNLAIIGAPYTRGGNAFIFDLTTGSLLHRLTASDSSDNALFGFSVAIDHGLAVVAAGQRNAAYVFDATTGQQLHKLTPINQQQFVRSVDISNGIAVLGAPTVNSAFLYNAVTGAQISRINGPTTSGKHEFGVKVAIEGDTTAIISPGFPRNDDVYVVDSNTGATKWTYGHSTTNGEFEAKNVAIDDGRVVLGGGRGTGSIDMPTAYVLDRTAGALIREIDIRTGNENDHHRYDLDVSGDRLVVGSFGLAQDEGLLVGAVHVFDVNTGDFVETIRNPNPASGDEFGFDIAYENGKLLVGAPGVDTDRGYQGLTYFYPVPEPTTLGLVGVWPLLTCLSRRRGT